MNDILKTQGNLKNFQNYLYIQRVAPSTREGYIRSVTQLSAFHKLPAERLSNHQIQDGRIYELGGRHVSANNSSNVPFTQASRR